MKSHIISVILLLIIENACAQIPEWKVYAAVPQVKSVLSKYENDGSIQNIIALKNINSRFLTLVREFLIIQNAYFECKGSNFMSVGYLSEDGTGVNSGADPESIKDLDLRKKYIERIAQNEENSKTVKKIAGIKNNLLNLMRETVDLMDDGDKVIAKTIVEELSSLKK